MVYSDQLKQHELIDAGETDSINLKVNTFFDPAKEVISQRDGYELTQFTNLRGAVWFSVVAPDGKEVFRAIDLHLAWQHWYNVA